MIRVHGFLTKQNVSGLTSQAKLAERAGFDGVCMSDHLVFPPPSSVLYDPWIVLTSVALNTSSLRFGTCVTESYRRHPAQTAQIVATLDELSSGRAFVMIGAGEELSLHHFGMNLEHPITRLREAVQIIKLLWSSDANRRVNFQGKEFSLKGAFLQVKSIQKPNPPIYVAGPSESSMRIAAELADGWLTHIESLTTFRQNHGKVKLFAEQAGRRLDELDVALFLPFIVARTDDQARSLLKNGKFVLAVNPKRLADAGFGAGIPDDVKMNRMTMDDSSLKKLEEAVSAVSDDALDEFVTWGTPEQCLERLNQYVKLGAKTLVLVNLNPDYEEFTHLVGKDILPHIRGMG